MVVFKADAPERKMVVFKADAPERKMVPNRERLRFVASHSGTKFVLRTH